VFTACRSLCHVKEFVGLGLLGIVGLATRISQPATAFSGSFVEKKGSSLDLELQQPRRHVGRRHERAMRVNPAGGSKTSCEGRNPKWPISELIFNEEIGGVDQELIERGVLKGIFTSTF
jgi:hypothetical protein